jgi:hypothetical protein
VFVFVRSGENGRPVRKAGERTQTRGGFGVSFSSPLLSSTFSFSCSSFEEKIFFRLSSSCLNSSRFFVQNISMWETKTLLSKPSIPFWDPSAFN